jgi:hypothetical protein
VAVANLLAFHYNVAKMSHSAPQYRVDPLDPRAPPQAGWDALSAEDRQRVLDALPSEIERAKPPEGDAHSRSKSRARDTLSEHFGRIGRRIYLASELPVYYPEERMFAPDRSACGARRRAARAGSLDC